MSPRTRLLRNTRIIFILCLCNSNPCFLIFLSPYLLTSQQRSQRGIIEAGDKYGLCAVFVWLTGKPICQLARQIFSLCTHLLPILFTIFVILLILAPQLRSQQRDRVGQKYLVLFCFVSDTKRWGRLAICFSTCLCFSLLTLFLLLIIFTVHDHIFTGFTYPYYYYACSPAHSGAAAGHSNGIEGGPGLCFVLFRFVAQKGETERQSLFLCVCVTLTHLVSITHPKAVNNTVFCSVLFCKNRWNKRAHLFKTRILHFAYQSFPTSTHLSSSICICISFQISHAMSSSSGVFPADSNLVGSNPTSSFAREFET